MHFHADSEQKYRKYGFQELESSNTPKDFFCYSEGQKSVDFIMWVPIIFVVMWEIKDHKDQSWHTYMYTNMLHKSGSPYSKMYFRMFVSVNP